MEDSHRSDRDWHAIAVHPVWQGIHQQLEETFGVELPAPACSRCETAADLAAEIARRLHFQDPDLTLTAAAAHRLRRSLHRITGVARERLVDATALDSVIPPKSRRELWAALGTELGLELPPLGSPRWIRLAAVAWIMAAGTVYFMPPMAGAMAAAGLLIVLLARHRARCWPLGCATFGGLAQVLARRHSAPVAGAVPVLTMAEIERQVGAILSGTPNPPASLNTPLREFLRRNGTGS